MAAGEFAECACVCNVRIYVWGCGRQLEQVEQVQLQAARIFLGVGRLHPKVALLFEMKMLPLKWEARSRCIDFWLKVLRMGAGG